MQQKEKASTRLPGKRLPGSGMFIDKIIFHGSINWRFQDQSTDTVSMKACSVPYMPSFKSAFSL